MSSSKSKKKTVYGLLGGVLLVAGITLVLVCWNDVVALFRGVTGMALAVGGLVLLSLIKAD